MSKLGLSIVVAAMTVAPFARALEPDQAGWYKTGQATYTKKVAFLTVDVYRIAHYTRALPSEPTRAATIALDADKRFYLYMLRDVDQGRISGEIRRAFTRNGYGDRAKIDRYVSAFSSDLEKGSWIRVSYDASTKTTTVQVDGGGTASVRGFDFMKATWSSWLGDVDPPQVAEQLVSNLKG